VATVVRSQPMPSPDPLDEVDWAILAELQQDGRRAFREIARNLDLSERTVRGRVHRMRQNGTLRILAFADPVHLGHSTLAMVLLRVETAALDRIVETVTGWPEVSYVSTLLGRPDLYLQVICRDNDELWNLVTHRLGEIEGILETETMLEIAVHKFSYTNTSAR
jgi:Lrp/AsnC family transcriptional regulator for asnA, asnC and gidA